MNAHDFDALVERSLARIPARFRRLLHNVVLVVEAEPPSPGLLGLYEGASRLTYWQRPPLSQPDRITIYQGPHERAARSAADLEKMVADTVWHEVAHHFGMNERQVRRAERRRETRRNGRVPPRW